MPSTIEVLKENVSNIDCHLIAKALGNEKGMVKFYYKTAVVGSAMNSAIQHHYLNGVIEVEQTTIDLIAEDYCLKKIDFSKIGY